jgi:hypothetical protein
MTELHLSEHIHPKREALKEYDALVGIDALKEALVDELVLILDRSRLDPGGERITQTVSLFSIAQNRALP